MLVTKTYDRMRAYEYAKKWAFSRNPLFANYSGIGGNCTNFVSQCLYAGSCIMNFTPVFGWYYFSDAERTASWTGVEFFYDFITRNTGVGPFGRDVAYDSLEVGDAIQLGREKDGFYHTLIVVGASDNSYLVSAQSDDAFDRPLNTYQYDFARYIHIDGVRIDIEGYEDCFEPLYNGEKIIYNGYSPTVLKEDDGTEQDLAPEAETAPNGATGEIAGGEEETQGS